MFNDQARYWFLWVAVPRAARSAAWIYMPGIPRKRAAQAQTQFEITTALGWLLICLRILELL
jgi:hypothetical protein